MIDLISEVMFQAVEHRRVYKLKPYDPSPASREQREGAVKSVTRH